MNLWNILGDLTLSLVGYLLFDINLIINNYNNLLNPQLSVIMFEVMKKRIWKVSCFIMIIFS